MLHLALLFWMASDPFQKGLEALQQNNTQEAIVQLSEAVRLHPGDARAHNFLGIALLSANRGDEAEREYRLAIAADAKFEDAERNLGFLEWSEQKNDDSVLHLKRALAMKPADDFARYYLARVYVDRGQAAEAARVLSNVNGDWARFDLALTYLYAKQFQLAAQTGTDAIAGIALSRLGKHEAAILRLQSAASSGSEESVLNLSGELMRVGRFADALAAVQNALAAIPKSYALHMRLGAAYLAMGDYANAETTFRALVDAGDPTPTSYVGLAQVLMRTGRANEAFAVMRDAEKHTGRNFLTLYFEGLTAEKSGDRDAALAAFQGAMAMNVGSAEAALGAGRVALAMGRNRQAIKYLSGASRLDPSSVAAKRLLARAYAKSGDSNMAAKYADAAREPVPDTVETSLAGDFILPDWKEP